MIICVAAAVIETLVNGEAKPPGRAKQRRS
jgi:hypothetical protein